MLSISIDLVSPHWLIGDGMAWQSYTFTSAQLAAAALTNTVTIAPLLAKQVLHMVLIKHSQSFTGGGIATYTVRVGVSGALAKYASPFDVFQAVSSNALQLSNCADIEDFVSPVNIAITAVSTGANLNAATQGSVTVWLLTSVLP